MLNLEQITCQPQQSVRLLGMGIKPIAYIWHEWIEAPELPQNPDGSPAHAWDTAIFRKPEPSDKLLPAWTKEELDVMIGPDMEKPDLFPKHLVSRATNPNTYPIAYPDKMRTYKSGAQASADALIYLIQKNIIAVDKANDRYMNVFKH